MKSKKNSTYVKKSFVMIKIKKKYPNKIPLKIHNGSTYDYHFLIKELTEEFKGQFECLGEKTEKYITFSVPIKKEHNIDKTIKIK